MTYQRRTVPHSSSLARCLAARLSGLLVLSLVWFTAPANHAAEDLPNLDLETPLRMDFSGSWEKDFRRSDDWEQELGRIFRIQQGSSNRDRGTGYTSRSSGPAVTLGNMNLRGGRGRGANIVDLARLAEYISRQSTITIVQSRNEIRIKREGDADLVCGMGFDTMTPYSSEYGFELCGWDRAQLVFEITLPDDLIIMHRFSVAQDSTSLQMGISLISKGSSSFNLLTFYNRYDAPAENFNCVQTLSRGRVCSQTSVPN